MPRFARKLTSNNNTLENQKPAVGLPNTEDYI